MISKLSIYLLSTFSSFLVADDWKNYYTVEGVPTPEKVNPQLGGITTLRDGRLAACFYSGEVMIYDTKSSSWQAFAQGLQCPLGVLEDDDGSLLVMQWSELTRLKDSDGDGLADHYETVTDDFGLTGNYHEFAYGPVKDSKGNLYVSLNVASNQAGIFKNVRGPFLSTGLERSILETGNKNEAQWKKRKREAGRMYSRVPYRGCVLQITPDGEMKPFAYGFRSPDGIGVDEKDRLWITDNQGDWRGTSPLYHVEEGGFYGHPASLVWKEGWTKDPLDVPVSELEALRTRAAGLFPQGELANSPTQPIPTIDPSLFGLPKGELLIGEMNQPTLIRFLKDEVDGTVQGTMISFLFGAELGIGSHRLAHSPDGTLWVGKTHLKWAGQEGLRKVTWNGVTPFLVNGVKLQKDGFAVHFNQSLSKEVPKLKVMRHTYHYHKEYGSPKVDEQVVEIQGVIFSEDRKSIQIKLPEVKEGYLYTISLDGGLSGKGQDLMDKILRYNVVKTVDKEGDDVTSKHEMMKLLDSGDLSQWRQGDKEGEWTLSNGVVYRGKKKAGSLMTRQKFKDFDLQFEFKISEGGNSGIIYRTGGGRGLEYQVLDDERHIRGETPNSSTAALYDLVAPIEDKPYKPAGSWNTGRIVVNGQHVEHWLNGVKVLEAQIGSEDWTKRFLKSKNKHIENFAMTGSPIFLQDHGAEVWYRNMEIREL